ncbi:helix-turn-helix transcriptional regulator [Clostridium botulinum]|uniref:helix-turn-helix transcriptional regulator n=1 Tax=Clostridium botulinum TaxID=1491 RepID=UPI0007E098E8|nr:helix-turn-helix domain-containing protein [Clostridium botulinum]KEI75864.1 DNA-binding protein [Clostridium botulinum B2 128]KEI92010.1 DNA-binding protein [Clostridium botulinum B2 275]
MSIRNRLLDIRLSMGYKHAKDFACFLGIGKSNYSLIENNKKQVTLDQAFKIAKKLNMKLEDIFELVDED